MVATKEITRELLIKVASGISFHTPVKLSQAHVVGVYVVGIVRTSSSGFKAVISIWM
jgi:hypothetical protein